MKYVPGIRVVPEKENSLEYQVISSGDFPRNRAISAGDFPNDFKVVFSRVLLNLLAGIYSKYYYTKCFSRFSNGFRTLLNV